MLNKTHKTLASNYGISSCPMCLTKKVDTTTQKVVRILQYVALAVFLFVLLTGCAENKTRVVAQSELVSCSIPQAYLTRHDVPKRNWNWKQGKKETDVIKYITDHRYIIETQNNQLEKIERVQENCQKNIDSINTKTIKEKK